LFAAPKRVVRELDDSARPLRARSAPSSTDRLVSTTTTAPRRARVPVDALEPARELRRELGMTTTTSKLGTRDVRRLPRPSASAARSSRRRALPAAVARAQLALRRQPLRDRRGGRDAQEPRSAF
jgi:hypothetical protein